MFMSHAGGGYSLRQSVPVPGTASRASRRLWRADAQQFMNTIDCNNNGLVCYITAADALAAATPAQGSRPAAQNLHALPAVHKHVACTADAAGCRGCDVCIHTHSSSSFQHWRCSHLQAPTLLPVAGQHHSMEHPVQTAPPAQSPIQPAPCWDHVHNRTDRNNATLCHALRLLPEACLVAWSAHKTRPLCSHWRRGQLLPRCNTNAQAHVHSAPCRLCQSAHQ
jgi:hypothetical protein